jgi:hypothetical protein
MPKGHRKNHYVPQSLLKHWEVQRNGRFGVHVFSLTNRQTTFERSRGRDPFAFAVAEDLYVPTIAGKRATAMEAGWLATMEASLAHFVRQAARRQPLATKRTEDLTKLAMALVCLEQRSRYNLVMLRDALEASPETRQLVTTSPEREVKRIVLENLVVLVTELHNSLVPLRYMFVHSTGVPFITCDRPTVVADQMPHRIAVLTPRLAVIYEKGRRTEYVHVDAEDDFVGTINDMMIGQARDWVVALTPEQLEWAAKETDSDDWRDHVAKDRPTFITPRFSTTGWTIPEPDE